MTASVPNYCQNLETYISQTQQQHAPSKKTICIATCLIMFGGLTVLWRTRVSESVHGTVDTLSGMGKAEFDRTSSRAITPVDASIPCIGSKPGKTEDIFCIKRPKYLSNYKNPCWYDAEQKGKGQRLKCLPFFHIIGVAKCGTDDLFSRIIDHVDIENHTLYKESQFWGQRRYGKYYAARKVHNFSWYTDIFSKASSAIESHVTNDNFHPKITADASVGAIYSFASWKLIPQNFRLREPAVLTPHLMNHIYRDPKFIVIYREPTERLYSSFFFARRGKTPEAFHRAVEKNLNLHNECLKTKTERLCAFNNRLKISLYAGCYSLHIREWLRVFPRENFLFLRTEDYYDNIKETIRKVFDFLDLKYNETFLTKVSQKPRAHLTASKHRAGPMFNKTRIILKHFYRKYIHELADILQDKKFLWDN